ncbi:monovalent cation:H+ antiporter, CPA1 (nhx1) [Elasticomyces elasticus]|nr:monovalent cation:H+ antiporter, CPA1 (nhx1) [Elasticomyces elasticus]
MSRCTKPTTKFTFSLTTQLSENFIFIYLGLSLFTELGLEYKPLFILVTSEEERHGSRGDPVNWKVLIFWAGLRGAIGVALAAGLQGPNAFALSATVLVVVVLTVIIFGGTTARMLEILDIRTGVVEEIDSDNEFDTEPIRSGAYSRRNGKAFGHA